MAPDSCSEHPTIAEVNYPKSVYQTTGFNSRQHTPVINCTFYCEPNHTWSCRAICEVKVSEGSYGQQHNEAATIISTSAHVEVTDNATMCPIHFCISTCMCAMNT